MTNGERMILTDAIEQAIELEKANIKLRRWLKILSVVCLILILAIISIIF